jgi:hypothetical protein
MIKRALCIALSLAGALFPIAAQQPRHREQIKDRAVTVEQLRPVGALEPAFALSFYQPKILSVASSSFLFRKGPVTTWSDGARLASENALAEVGMAPLNLFPVAFLTPDVFEMGPRQNGSPARRSRSENSGTDGKDPIDEIIGSPLDRVYYGGEVGVLYGQWTGKGGGDLLETYIMGTVGNDKFQITAGAAYEEWSGRAQRFRSFATPR